MNRWLAVSGIVLVAALATLAFLNGRSGQPVEAVAAQRSDIREFVEERGKTRLPRSYVIAMPSAGRVQQIELDEGDPVRAGQVVASMVQEDLALAVAEAKAIKQRFEASVEENEDDALEENAEQQAERLVESMSATVAAADYQMQTSQRRMEYSQRFLDRIQQLARTQAETANELDQAELDFVESQLSHRQDGLVLQAVQAIDAAIRLVPQMVSDYVQRKRLRGKVLTQQKAEAEARLQQMLLRQQRGQMQSPVAGVVLQRFVHSEQYLAAGTQLLEIGDLNQLEVEADILSQDAVAIKKGSAVEFYGAAIERVASSPLRGTVHRVHPAGFTKISSLGVEEQRVKVIFRFADPPHGAPSSPGLGVDYRVRVRVVTASKSNALTIARPALFRDPSGRWQVFAVRRGRAVLQPVEVGLMNDERAEITAGLQDGELVILAPERSLVDGARVKASLPVAPP